jgi:hypothetical protein
MPLPSVIIWLSDGSRLRAAHVIITTNRVLGEPMRLIRPFGFALLLLALILPGCSTPPNVQPFAESTQALNLSVSSTATNIHARIQPIDKELAAQFQKAWSHRIEAMAAMADYSDSLVAIVESANQSAQTAQQVFDSANALLGTIAKAYPGGDLVVDAVSKASTALCARYAKDRAASSVAAALRDTDPAIQDVAAALAADFATMKNILKTLRMDEEQQYLARFDRDDPSRLYLNLLRDQARYNAVLAATQPAIVPLLHESHALIGAEMARPWYAQHQAALKAIHDRYDRYDALVGQAAALTTAWGQSHAALIQAAQSNRTPAFRVLIEMTREMLQIYNEARKK